MKIRGLNFLVLLVVLTGCAPQVTPAPPTETPPPTATAVVLETIVVEQLVPVKTPTPSPVHASATPLSYVPSDQAAALARQSGIVRIERAYCSYHPDIDGQPTFCNDQPYPNHTFTLLVWRADWSFLDGKCLLVQGDIDLYEGRPEIIADSLDQVFECP